MDTAKVVTVGSDGCATYRLEGDGLEILLVHETIEPLRAFGRSLGKDASDLPSVSALLRAKCVIAQGTCIREYKIMRKSSLMCLVMILTASPKRVVPSKMTPMYSPEISFFTKCSSLCEICGT